MVNDSVSTAVAKRKEGPSAAVVQYSKDFSDVLPSHIRADTWIRLAQGVLRKGKRDGDGRTELEKAAANNMQAFMLALRDAARLGLEPGTEQFYLVPRKVKGVAEIQGIIGWQGFVELMYRAGAISSVVCECVYTEDTFQFRPGVDERPVHGIDWDAESRGALRLVYSYAIMRDGATSKVVVLNRVAIDKIKASSQGADSAYSPWTTHEPAMWMKSAVRQLAKWVPTSSEYLSAQIKAQLKAYADSAPDVNVNADLPTHEQPIDVSGLTELRDDDPDLFEAEIVE